MRIGLIYDAVWPWVKGGAQRFAYELGCALRDRGHEVHIFGMQYWQGPADMVREGLHYHGLCRALPLYTAGGRRSIWAALRFAWGLFRRFPRYRAVGFDVVHLLVSPVVSVPAFWLMQRLSMQRVPWALYWSEVWGRAIWREYLGFLGMAAAAVEQWAASLAPVHVCASPTTARRLREQCGVPESKIEVIPCGFSLPAGIVTEEPRHPLKALVAGRLVAYKRVDLLIRAWPHVLARVPEAELHIVGEGPDRAGCERLAASEGVALAVHFRGQMPDNGQMLREIGSAGLLLQPSLREGQSLVVGEALSLGTPVLAADGPATAVADFIGRDADSRDALLPVEAEPQEWANRIVRLMTDRETANRLSARGRAQVAELSWQDHIAPRMEALYRRLAAQRPGMTSHG
jgi:glycosyltransferase involved in cell wall biosynthesis